MDTSPEQNKLPSQPSLEHLQKQAKRRVRENPSLQLAAAQHQIAQEYGFKNWAELAKVVLAQSSPNAAEKPGKSQVTSVDAGSIQSRVEAMVKGTTRGIGLVRLDKEGARHFYAGRLSSAESAPPTSESLFSAGSITKVFTALLFAESELAGKVSRLDPVAKYILPVGDPLYQSVSDITLLSLATHTSGLPRMPANFMRPPLKKMRWDEYGQAELLEAFVAAGPGARAGRETPLLYASYSNFGFALLGEALAQAWKMSFEDLLTKLILEPLGMAATRLGMKAFAPAGGLMTTTQDMAKFLAFALTTDAHPLRTALDVTLAPQCENGFAGGKVGLGWMLAGKHQPMLAWHNGATAEGKAFMGINRRDGLATAVFATAGSGPDALGFELLGAKSPRTKTERVPNAAAYVGKYPLGAEFPGGSNAGIDITEFKGGLMAQMHGGAAVNLRSIGVDRFAMVGLPMEIQFERDKSGNIAALTLLQRAIRGPSTTAPAKMAVSPDLLRDYSGCYRMTSAFTIEITVEGEGLLVQVTGQPKRQAFAFAKDRFYILEGCAELHFRRDPADVIDGVVLLRAGRNLVGRKTS